MIHHLPLLLLLSRPFIRKYGPCVLERLDFLVVKVKIKICISILCVDYFRESYVAENAARKLKINE